MNTRKSFIILLMLLVSSSLLAIEEKILMPEDEKKIPSAGAPALSPDGKWIAFSLSRYDEKADDRESDIYIVPFEGGDPIQLTSVPGSERGYDWHPTKPLIAFSANRDGKGGKNQIYVIDIRGGEARKITDVKNGAYSPLWSPDGSRIAFYSDLGRRYSEEEEKAFGDVIYAKNLRYYHLGPGWDEGERQRIFVVSAEGGEAVQLTNGPCADEGDHSMAWSPDSQEIAFVSNREEEWWNTIDTNIFTVNVSTKEIRKISNNIGPDHSPAYSPDGTKIAWRGSFRYNYESENYKILVQPVDGDEYIACCASLDRNINRFAWGKDGNRIYFSASSDGYRHIQYFDLEEPEKFYPVTSGDLQIRYWNTLGDGTFALLAGTSVSPYEIYSFVDNQPNCLTSYATEWFEGYELSPSEELWITTDDGARVQGWLVKPVDYQEGQKYPMILVIHGGPHGMYGPSLRLEYQMYAQRGYAVLYTNPRGSDGYGQDFADIIKEDWHTHPTIDLMAFVDHVVDMGVADPDKLGVTGGSYGGYMTNWLIGATDRFKAAVSVAGLSNMVSFYGSTDEQFFAEHEMAGPPWLNKEKYLDNSPLWQAENFVTPTMVVHGSNDWRVRPEQGRQLFVALQKMGVPSVWVEFPDEQHGVRGTTHRELYYRLKLDWFGHWLKGEDPGLATYITPKKYQHPPEMMETPKH